jgi:hypothetical protein
LYGCGRTECVVERIVGPHAKLERQSKEMHIRKRALLISMLVIGGLLLSGVANAQLNLKQFGIGGGDSSADGARLEKRL